MTHAISNSEIIRRIKSGQRPSAIAQDLGVSSQVISYRLRTAGVSKAARKNPVSPSRVRALRDSFGTLEQMREFLEQTREALVARMGDRPGPKTLERLGMLTDFINTLQELTE